MADTITATILIDGVGNIIKAISTKVIGANNNQQRREALSSAIVAIQRAAIRTRKFIDEEGYSPNLELTELWQDALQKSINAKIKEVPEYLFYKAQFWSEPDLWLDADASMKLVPKLKYLNEQCEVMLKKLN